MNDQPTATRFTTEFLALFGSIIDALAELPAEVTAVEYRYESFGSWSFVVRRHGTRYRVDFDGRDRALLIYRVPSPGREYSEPSHLIAEHPLASGLTDETVHRVVAATIDATSRAG